jgi:putative FmdB family regulatory protein
VSPPTPGFFIDGVNPFAGSLHHRDREIFTKGTVMPVFDYECAKCAKKFDVFHKGKEIAEDVECPSCGSKEYRRLMSIPAAARIGGSHDAGFDAPSACDSCCSNGSCGMN